MLKYLLKTIFLKILSLQKQKQIKINSIKIQSHALTVPKAKSIKHYRKLHKRNKLWTLETYIKMFLLKWILHVNIYIYEHLRSQKDIPK